MSSSVPPAKREQAFCSLVRDMLYVVETKKMYGLCDEFRRSTFKEILDKLRQWLDGPIASSILPQSLLGKAGELYQKSLGSVV